MLEFLTIVFGIFFWEEITIKVQAERPLLKTNSYPRGSRHEPGDSPYMFEPEFGSFSLDPLPLLAFFCMNDNSDMAKIFYTCFLTCDKAKIIIMESSKSL
jgi:hypothetical protein